MLRLGQSSPYMGKEIEKRKQEMEKEGDKDVVQSILQDEDMQKQIEELVKDPASLQRVQNQSEQKLKVGPHTWRQISTEEETTLSEWCVNYMYPTRSLAS